MWYFAWVLGLALACSFSVLNAMWYESRADERNDRREVLEGA